MKDTGLIFDVDGTLWDSSYRVAESWDIIFKKYDDIDISCTRDSIMNVMGKTMTDIADIFFPKLDYDKKMAYLKECELYELEYLRENPPELFYGAKEVIKELSQRYPLFIVSNCQSGYVELFMKIGGLEDYITDFECFGNNMKKKADNIRLVAERNNVFPYYYIGDIQSDHDATVEAGGRFIYAAYGFGSIREEVPVINDIRDLPGLMSQICPV